MHIENYSGILQTEWNFWEENKLQYMYIDTTDWCIDSLHENNTPPQLCGVV